MNTRTNTILTQLSQISQVLQAKQHIPITHLMPGISDEDIKILFQYAVQSAYLHIVKYIIENTSNVFELNDFEQALLYAEKSNNLQLYMYIFYIIRVLYNTYARTHDIEKGQEINMEIPIKQIANIKCQDCFYLLCVKK